MKFVEPFWAGVWVWLAQLTFLISVWLHSQYRDSTGTVGASSAAHCKCKDSAICMCINVCMHQSSIVVYTYVYTSCGWISGRRPHTRYRLKSFPTIVLQNVLSERVVQNSIRRLENHVPGKCLRLCLRGAAICVYICVHIYIYIYIHIERERERGI